jgi:GxxExxY protein
MDKKQLNDLSNKIINCSLRVHRNLGPGLLESTYSQCLAYELNQAGLNFKIEHPIPVQYGKILIDCAYRADFIVEDEIILELKSVNEILPIHKAQLITYLKISNKRLGLLINFNTKFLRNGIKRIVNNL